MPWVHRVLDVTRGRFLPAIAELHEPQSFLRVLQGMVQPIQRLGFNLSYSLPGQPEFSTDFFQRMGWRIIQPKAHSQHGSLACIQRRQ